VKLIPRILVPVVCCLLVALTTAVPAFATDAAATKTSTTASKAKDTSKDKRSASERRAADSAFEREKLDQSAFEDTKKSSDSSPAPDPGSGGSMLRALFGLIVVLGTIYGVYWLLKKWGKNRMDGGVAGKTGIIDVVATTQLAQGRAIHVVRVGGELVLVGATEQSITRLGDLDANKIMGSSGNAGNGEFQAMLNGALMGDQPGVAAATNPGPFHKRLIDNLRLSTAR